MKSVQCVLQKMYNVVIGAICDVNGKVMPKQPHGYQAMELESLGAFLAANIKATVGKKKLQFAYDPISRLIAKLVTSLL